MARCFWIYFQGIAFPAPASLDAYRAGKGGDRKSDLGESKNIANRHPDIAVQAKAFMKSECAPSKGFRLKAWDERKK